MGDFAVQVASGTPALRALIQQGTQLVSMFGPWGAVIGAAGAVLGGIVTYLTATGDAADKAETKLWKYADALDAIRERNVSSRLSGLSPVGQILDAGRSDLEQLERQLQDAIVKRDAMIAALNPDLSQGRSPFQSANPDFQKALDAAAATQRDRYQAVSTPEIDAANQQIAELQAAIDDLRVTELGNAFEDLRRSLNPGEAAWAKYREQLELIDTAIQNNVAGAAEMEAALKAAAKADLQKALKGPKDRERDKADPYARAFLQVSDRTADLRRDLAVFDQGSQAIARARAESDLLSAALAAGRPITADLRTEIALLASEYANAQAALEAKEAGVAEANKRDATHAATLQAIAQAQRQLMPTYQRMIAEAEAWRDSTLAGLDETKAGYQEFANQVEQIFQGQVAAAMAQARADSRSFSDGAARGLAEYADAARNSAASAEQATVGAFKGMEDALVEFTTTGKVSFGSLIDSMIADIARMTIQQNITAPIASYFSSAIGGLFHSGGMANAPSQSRRVDPAVFIGAPRFHSGGMGYDGLSAGERAVIVRQEEGIFTPRQMENADQLLSAALGAAARPSQAAMPVINIYEAPGTKARPQTRQGSGGGAWQMDLLIEEIDGRMAENARSGKSQFAQVLERKHGLTRGAAAIGR